ncbi:MAG TPA: DUF4349 domain-containing protein [Candidatus Sulfotelmatobacter sp.]|nr:DUF4349 domain-containing protein [Candidatus Sulfotelmatobacter sp.]
MTSLAHSLAENKKTQWIVAGIGICLVWAAIAIPGLYRSRTALGPTSSTAHMAEGYFGVPTKTKALAQPSVTVSLIGADKTHATESAYSSRAEAVVPRKIVRTSSLDMVVAHPSETAERITALAQGLGGYLETSNSGGPDVAAATLTVRVPADGFERARAEIRKLGLRVESERVDAQDVTREYVDQDASLRNLRAEEAQYLTILKQATTVKDMLAVSEKLSEVRGEIEQQQAEFQALSRQIETVSIVISLRTEAQAQTFGLNWRPLYHIKLALYDGLESVANYATIMVGVLFYLPAVLLWVGTIAIAGLGPWRIVRWIGKRWLGWNTGEAGVKA